MKPSGSGLQAVPATESDHAGKGYGSVPATASNCSISGRRLDAAAGRRRGLGVGGGRRRGEEGRTARPHLSGREEAV
jgi:hypothetical protein